MNQPLLAYVQMPSGDALQPLPKAAHANVSGNVNATTKPAVHSVATDTATIETVTAKGAPAPARAHSFGWGWYAAGLMFVLICVLVWYFLLRVPE